MKKILLILFVALLFDVASAENEGGNLVGGFRICVFNGTQQDARERANSAVSSVRSAISTSIATKMMYDAPVFKVYVGACLNRTEATILLARLKKIFSNAFIVNDKIDIKEFAGTPSMIDFTIEQTENIDQTKINAVD